MSDANEPNIVVIASEAMDRALVDSLLEASGLRLAPGALREAGREPIPEARVIVVCHRASAATPMPSLPDVEGARRVVVLSDCLSEPAMVQAFESGAHHYFDIDESRVLLQARLAAALRSHFRHAQRQLVVPPFRFDLAKRRAWHDERPVGLSPKEFDLAYYLFTHRGRTVGNRELMTAVWSLPRATDSRRIDTAACRVRKKMALDETEGWHLRRLRGQGYLLITDTRRVARDPDECERMLDEMVG